mgnify:CR=1 FL=1
MVAGLEGQLDRDPGQRQVIHLVEQIKSRKCAKNGKKNFVQKNF